MEQFSGVNLLHSGMETLIKLQELLELERQEDLEQFKALVEKQPLAERIVKGFSWYGVRAIKSGYTYGERAFVIVEREGRQEHPEHQFRAGKTVRLFCEVKDGKPRERTGVLQFVDRNRLKIVLNARDLPDWLDLGVLGVDLLFDERSYQEMEKALKKVIQAKRDRLAELRDILLGEQPPAYYPTPHPVEIPELNPSQNQAINRILASRDVAVIHGPPGTGKTTTLVHAIRILCQTEGTVLVTAPSNTAVDLLVERLSGQGLTVVRIGNISRVEETIIRHTLEAQLSQHPESKNIKKVKIQAAEYRRQARKFRRTFGREERSEREHLEHQAKELDAWANQLENRLIGQILDGAQVIACTLVGASHPVLAGRKFRTAVIDEAAQALEPATWIPIIRASRVVLAGDPFQLPPTVKSLAAQRGGLDITLLEKLIRRWPEVDLLNIQYRMHLAIMGFSNHRFYGGALRAAESVAEHQLGFGSHPPVTFIDTAGCGFDEMLNPETQSRYNPHEFGILCEHLYQVAEFMEAFEEFPSIGIISPYREQVQYMEKEFREDGRINGLPATINTIDGFQGQERDIIYLSLVRSNEKGDIGFLKDYRRMNVAMTRARKWLVVVGDSSTIGANDFYKDFLDYVDREGEYTTAWSYLKT